MESTMLIICETLNQQVELLYCQFKRPSNEIYGMYVEILATPIPFVDILQEVIYMN